jgi:glycerate kinase
MKILIAPDKFKGICTAQEAAESLRNNLQKLLPQAQIRLVPIADGGEGTLISIIYLLQGKIQTVFVHDPLMREKEAQWGWAQLPDKDTAILEMSQASGLFRLTPQEFNPMETTSYGTGELILEALRNQAKQIKIALGGSATVDGGIGFLQALGVIFKSKLPLPPSGVSGKHLLSITSIDIEPALHKLKGVGLTGWVDVQVPLLGDHGAARFFGPSKGATPEMVEVLEKGLFHFENLLSNTTGLVLKNHPGAGAAGGLGMAILALGGKLEKGFDFVAQTLKLEENMKGCDLVITGEGKLDDTSREGKAPVAVARLAKKMGIKCLGIVGCNQASPAWLPEEGFTKVYALYDAPFEAEDPKKFEFSKRLSDTLGQIFPKK